MSKSGRGSWRDWAAWYAWESELARAEQVDYHRNLVLYEAMYEEAQALGVLPPLHPLEGLEEKIRFVERLNVSRIARRPGTSA